MTKEELKNKYSAFITEISEILGLGKPIDVLKLCATTDLFFQPLEKHIEELEKENAELKELIKNIISVTWGEGWNYSLDWKVKAEQFLKKEAEE